VFTVAETSSSIFKECYTKRITGGILGYPHRKRSRDLATICQRYFGKKTLDIGCGDLYFDKDIIPQQNSFVGCDLGWEDSLRKAKANIEEFNWENVEVTQSVGEYLPYRSQIFELVLCFETLEHVDDEEKVLEEINRVTSEDAILVVSAPIEFGLMLILKEIFRELVSSPIYRGSHSKAVRKERYSLKEILAAGVFGKPDLVQRVPHAHKGYDYRRTLELLNPDWQLIEQCNYPTRFLPDFLSYGCILVLKKL
jgi:ubiquinone/menaquinone biosynthesis C-methylase UbiE